MRAVVTRVTEASVTIDGAEYSLSLIHISEPTRPG